MRALLSTSALVFVLLVAGCGGDDDGDGGGGGSTAKPGGSEGAQAFIDCFKVSGYEAVKPGPREESLFAYSAKEKGYAVAPVNVRESGNTISASVFLVFFDSQEKAKEALEELGRTSIGDVPPQQRGAAVIGYFSEEDRSKTGPVSTVACSGWWGAVTGPCPFRALVPRADFLQGQVRRPRLSSSAVVRGSVCPAR
jgi:hypothetical protein